MRLDQYVAEQLPELSRAFAAKLIERGQVSVNGAVQTKPGNKLRETDSVKIDFDPKAQAEVPEIELPVIYEDRSCVVINKPVGVLTHSKGAFNPEATVATWLSSRLAPGLSGERGGIVHRLDRATSGVMICAKTPEGLSWLQKQFSQRKAKKTYLAIVRGQLDKDEALIDMPIERNPRKPQTFRVGANGKSSQTFYKVLETTEDYSLLQLLPTTGRTHQLRVHLNEIGHPIVGDTLYGGESSDRLLLHALSLEITLPNRKRETFVAPEPAEFKEFMSRD
ncbi:MAG TPA: RluA family pseudouridine synthase [Candidatus Saccharimonadales bacterium]|nr:RluA family pseudouridine synthase [Candidatus Saccharimonadales bacterium]